MPKKKWVQMTCFGFLQFHRFEIPSEASWKIVKETTQDIGKAIQTALRTIEAKKCCLAGVFGDAQWTNKERLPDHLLKDLIGTSVRLI